MAVRKMSVRTDGLPHRDSGSFIWAGDPHSHLRSQRNASLKREREAQFGLFVFICLQAPLFDTVWSIVTTVLLIKKCQRT